MRERNVLAVADGWGAKLEQEVADTLELIGWPRVKATMR